MIQRFKWWILLLVAAGSVYSDEPRRSIVEDQSAAARELSTVVRDIVSERDAGTVGELIPQQWWDAPQPSSLSVILIPGLLAGDDSMSRIQLALNQNGIATATFRYADHLPIDLVSQRLADTLKHLQQKQPQRKLCLLTHSLGGIVARAAIESEDRSPCEVKRLIMVSPPNHGTELATFSAAELAGCLEPLVGESLDLSVINEMVSGFLGDAKESLQPGSALLATLNARPRASGVRYTIIAGTGGPIRREWVELPLLVTELIVGDATAEQKELAPLRRLATTGEWLVGSGDGVVSARSAQLAGVKDFSTFSFCHNDFGSVSLGASRRDEVDRAIDMMLDRVKKAVE